MRSKLIQSLAKAICGCLAALVLALCAPQELELFLWTGFLTIASLITLPHTEMSTRGESGALGRSHDTAEADEKLLLQIILTPAGLHSYTLFRKDPLDTISRTRMI